MQVPNPCFFLANFYPINHIFINRLNFSRTPTTKQQRSGDSMPPWLRLLEYSNQSLVRALTSTTNYEEFRQLAIHLHHLIPIFFPPSPYIERACCVDIILSLFKIQFEQHTLFPLLITTSTISEATNTALTICCPSTKEFCSIEIVSKMTMLNLFPITFPKIVYILVGRLEILLEPSIGIRWMKFEFMLQRIFLDS